MDDLNQLESDINSMESAMKNLENRFSSIVGKSARDIIRQNFILQGYDSGAGFKSWKKRSKATNTAYDYNRNSSYRTPKLHKISRYKNPYKGSVVNSKNPIMRQTGNLMDSVDYRVQGKLIEVGVFPKTIVINGVSHNAVNYAQIHNEGGVGQWGKHSTKIPRRQFMPRPSDNPNPKIIKVAKEKWDDEEHKIMAKWKS